MHTPCCIVSADSKYNISFVGKTYFLSYSTLKFTFVSYGEKQCSAFEVLEARPHVFQGACMYKRNTKSTKRGLQAKLRPQIRGLYIVNEQYVCNITFDSIFLRKKINGNFKVDYADRQKPILDLESASKYTLHKRKNDIL